MTLITLKLRSEELSDLADIADRQYKSWADVIRAALRDYRIAYQRSAAGETCVWSGDAKRAAFIINTEKEEEPTDD